MTSAVDAALCSWPFAPWLLATLLLTAGIYLRGWTMGRLRLGIRAKPQAANGPAALLGSLAAIYLALASPIEPLAHLLVQVHMLQHMLLTMVAAPLLWLAAPLLPMLRGLPGPVLVHWVTPLMATRPLRRFFTRLTQPQVALPIFVAVTWLWHVPWFYDRALRSDGWHYAQHGSFFAAALLFWYPVVRPYPCRPRWSMWLLFPYLLLADLSNTLLSAMLTFSGRVLYPYYTEVPRLGGISVLDDQAAAGVLMWVPGSLVFLVPLFFIGVRLLFGEEPGSGGQESEVRGQESAARSQAPGAFTRRIALPLVSSSLTADARPGSLGFDLLRVALLGRFLRWRHARIALQIPLVVIAGFVIFDGLFGPQIGALNLAGVLPWIHWRGLLILGLLAAGNFFCMGCPFLLPRTIARLLLPARWHWPRRLRSKWLAVLLVALFLWTYEALALWDRPLWTACLALGYFAAALVIDGLFRGASFCKYLCPIGQFNFVQSLASPLEIKPREPAVCDACQTKDCIRGRDGIPGCELGLFLPGKAGNMDCTTCLDCVHACPHDNVGLIAGLPAAELWHDRHRSGVGRFAQRRDIAALIVLLVFGAFANAAGMIAPVANAEAWLATQMGIGSPLLMTTAFYLVALALVPLLAVGGAAALCRWWGRLDGSLVDVATRYAYCLLPLGFGIWLAHYLFHFLTSWDAVIPVAQRFAADLGLTMFGDPDWTGSCCRPAAPWLLPVELLFLDFGLLFSLYSGYRLAPSLKALAPWALLVVLLFAAGVWVLFQPMQMRGTLFG